MATNIKGPSALLRQLRNVMAEELEPQHRLNTIVSDIASSMDAEVCSAYVLRADGLLELYATKGLNQGSVHVSVLRLGQGLVGTIAATARFLNLNEAQQHPAFAYLPETGEEVFNAFLGVPILRAGRVLGVLVVQNTENRVYTDLEIEALETIAMVLGELIATGELEGLSAKDVSLDLSRPLQLEGMPLSDGVALGYVILHEPRVLVTNLFNERAEDEIKRLQDALMKVQNSLDVLLSDGRVPVEGEHRDVLEAYRMFAHDRGWNRRIEEAIRAGLTAEAAVERVQNDNRARMMRIPDPYLRERLNDFDDLANRLQRELVGRPDLVNGTRFERDHILVARSMGAAELLDYHSEKLRGLVLEEATPTSHVVIVAKALGLPVVGQLDDIASNAESGNPIIVDGNEGMVSLRPPPDVEEAYVDKVKFQASRQKKYKKLLEVEPVSKDGVRVSLNMNAGLVMDLQQLDQSGADGVGLYRTELQFMVSETLPRPGEQESLYKRILDDAGDRAVTFRTLDIGGDKVLPYLKTGHEENPALGWRAIRLTLDRPGLLRSQVRALLKAAAGRSLRMMIPMVSEVWEVEQVKELIRREVEQQSRFGHEMPRRLELGAMLEVPSLLHQLDELMEIADFVAVGSNDLFQFLMASDRGNPRLSRRFSPFNKAFMRVLRKILEKGREHETPVTLCGEIAGRPLSAMALMGLGFRSISMAPAAIGPVKDMLLNLNIGELESVLLEVLRGTGGNMSIEGFLADYAERNNIPI